MVRIEGKPRRVLRRLVHLAHRRELAEQLAELGTCVDRWRAGEMDEFALSDHIHNFHDGVARDLFRTYVQGELELAVARAVAKGVLRAEEVTPDILESLQDSIACFHELGGPKGSGSDAAEEGGSPDETDVKD